MDAHRRLYEQLLFDEWLKAINSVFDCIYQQRRAQLRPGGSYDNGFNAAGFHEVSHAWGRVNQCERLFPELLLAEAGLRVIHEEAVQEAESDALMHTRLGLVLQGAAA